MFEGNRIDTAPLETIDFARLAAKEAAEIAKLFKSCQTQGFFYLDLQNDATRQILTDMQNILRVTKKYFGQSRELKMKDYGAEHTHGFKPADKFAGVVEKGSRVCYESFQVMREEMVQKAPVLPGIVHNHVELFEHFTSLSHYITHVLLSCLSDALMLGDDDRLEKSHRDGEPSNTALKMLYYPTNTNLANAGDNKHTDSGSLTLLFAEQWGLQVELPETQNWAFVEPRAGHAIANVADSLHFLSRKRLYSCMHRVAQPGGGCQKESRFSIVYFLRPENATKFEETDEKEVPVTSP